MRILTALTLCLGFGPLGCGGDFCSKSYDRRKECASPSQRGRIPERAEFLATCRESAHDTQFEAAVGACLELDDCAAVTKCTSAAEDALYTDKHIAAIMAAGSGDDVKKMKDVCQYIDEDKADLVAACAPVMVKLVAASTAEVTKMRDEGTHDYHACRDLESFAKLVGPADEARAKILCREAQASANVVKALAASAANVQANKPDMPYVCGGVLKELAAIDTEWARGNKAAVVTACFDKLGLVIMQRKVPEMKYVCDFRVKEIYDAVEEHNLQSEALKAWMLKADPLCAVGGSVAVAGTTEGAQSKTASSRDAKTPRQPKK